MADKPDWRSQEYADRLKNLDLAGFAQEFLRRNSEYREDADRVLGGDGDPEDSAQRDAVAQKWGLLFRLSARPVSLAISCLMAA